MFALQMFSNDASDLSGRHGNSLYANRDAIVSSFDLPSLISTSSDLASISESSERDLPFSNCDSSNHEVITSSHPSPTVVSGKSSKIEVSHQLPHRLSIISERTEPGSPTKEQPRRSQGSSQWVAALPSQPSAAVPLLSSTRRGSFHNTDPSSRLSVNGRPPVIEDQTELDPNLSQRSVSLASQNSTSVSSSRSQSSRSLSGAIKAYPIPRWTIPKPPPPPRPPCPPPQHNRSPSCNAIASGRVPSLASMSTTTSEIKGGKAPARDLTSILRPDTPMSKLETKLQQEALQIACLIGAPEPTRHEKSRPNSFQDRLDHALTERERQHEQCVKLKSERPRARNSSPLARLEVRLKNLSTVAEGVEKLQSQLDKSWGVVPEQADNEQLVSKEHLQPQICSRYGSIRSIVSAPPKTKSPIAGLASRALELRNGPMFLQCPQERHLFYPVYLQLFSPGPEIPKSRSLQLHRLSPLSLLGDGSLGLDFEVTNASVATNEELRTDEEPATDCSTLCDMCSRAIAQTKWVCRMSGCGAEVCTQCKAGLEMTT